MAVAIAAVLGLWMVARLDMDSPLLPGCILYRATGLYCTGCGMTRALHLLLHGHPYAAFRMNPLAIASLPFLAGYFGVAAARRLMGRPRPGMPSWVPWALLVLVVAYTVARNLPWMPFVWLAPTGLNCH